MRSAGDGIMWAGFWIGLGIAAAGFFIGVSLESALK